MSGRDEAGGREQATVTAWLDGRGFGFLRVADMTRGLFIGSAALRKAPGERVSLQPGDVIEFTRATDASGRPHAADAQIVSRGAER